MLVIEKLKKEASSHQSYEIFIRDKVGTLLLIVYFLILKDFNDLVDNRWTFMVNNLKINYTKATRIYTDHNQKWK